MNGGCATVLDSSFKNTPKQHVSAEMCAGVCVQRTLWCVLSEILEGNVKENRMHFLKFSYDRIVQKGTRTVLFLKLENSAKTLICCVIMKKAFKHIKKRLSLCAYSKHNI